MTGYRHSTPPHAIEAPEAVGVLDSQEALQGAMYDLLLAGFTRFDISVLGSQEALEAKFGSRFWRSAELADDPEAPRAAFVSEEAVGELEGAIAGGFLFLGSAVAMTALLGPASGALASVAALAVGGTPGAVLGTLLARRVQAHHVDYYANQIAHGGILLWVRVADKERERIAVGILKAHSGRDVHVHPWSMP